MNVSSTNKQRKYLIAIGSPSCDAMSLNKLNRVETDIKKVEKLLKEQGYERVLKDSLNTMARSDVIKNTLTPWFNSSERCNSDCVIIYYAGHAGEGREPNSHYLYTIDSHPSNLLNTAIKTDDLVNLLFSGNINSTQNILLILDVCYAGQGAKNVLASSLTQNRRATKNIIFGVIASADSNTEAGDGDFVDAFEKVMNESNWMSKLSNSEFLNPSDLVIHINKILEENCKAQKAEYSILSISREITFFRNPHFLSQNNHEYNPKKDSTKDQKIAESLWLLDYSTQEQVFKNVMQDCKETAFLVQTDVEKIQNWLVRRLAGCVGDFEKAKKYQIRIRRHQMRYNFDALFQEFKQDVTNELNCDTVIQGLAELCKQKSIIIAIYGLSYLEPEKVIQFHAFWLDLVNQVSSVERFFRSHLILLLAEKNEPNVLKKLHPFQFMHSPAINEPQSSILLNPLEKILQKDVTSWLVQKNVYDLLNLENDEIQSIVREDIPQWKETPLEMLE